MSLSERFASQRSGIQQPDALSLERKPVNRPDLIRVSVVGASQASDTEVEHAFEVGRYLAEAGAVVVCGGGDGVMKAACRGAQAVGGLTIGILPGLERSQANEYVRLALPTGMGQMRNALVVQAGQAVIAIGGGPGTLSEIALAFRYNRPVIGLGSWQATDARGRDLVLMEATSPEQAVRLALERV